MLPSLTGDACNGRIESIFEAVRSANPSAPRVGAAAAGEAGVDELQPVMILTRWREPTLGRDAFEPATLMLKLPKVGRTSGLLRSDRTPHEWRSIGAGLNRPVVPKQARTAAYISPRWPAADRLLPSPFRRTAAPARVATPKRAKLVGDGQVAEAVVKSRRAAGGLTARCSFRAIEARWSVSVIMQGARIAQPTSARRTRRRVADVTGSTVSAAPKPKVWALTIAGIGLIRRRASTWTSPSGWSRLRLSRSAAGK